MTTDHGPHLHAVAGGQPAPLPTTRWDARWADVPPEWRAATYRFDRTPFTEVFVRNTNYLRSDKEYPFTIHGPQRLTDELAWWVWVCWSEGWRKIDPAMLAWWKRSIDEIVARRAQFSSTPVTSLTDFDPDMVSRLALDLFTHRKGRAPSDGNLSNLNSIHESVHMLLSGRCLDVPWWDAPRWHLRVDDRIPRREHEPSANAIVNIGDIQPLWLRDGVRIWLRDMLISDTYRWTTVVTASREVAGYFGRYCHQRGIAHPALISDPDDVREFATGFLSWLRSPAATGRGTSLGQNQVSSIQSKVQSFYDHMVDERVRVAKVTGDDRWLTVGAAHTTLFPRALRGRRRQPDTIDRDKFISAADLSLMACHIPILGTPTTESVTVTVPGTGEKEFTGLGDESAMRAWFIQSLTGRRVSEILMLDFEPLTMLFGPDEVDAAADDAFVARLRYQQTKVDGVDPSILVEAEVVHLIRAQQQWVRDRYPDAANPRYLFPALRFNHRGTEPRPRSSQHDALRRLDELVQLTDQGGHPLKFATTHRLRHTRATELLAGGVPIHVVQRYLGHQSPEMTMRYAKTLAETAEAEFLKYKKYGADAREIDLAPHEIYDMTMLGNHTDRVLPNGVCMLPPSQTCDKGNACLGCSHFATDRSNLEDHRAQRTTTLHLIEQRKRDYLARTGNELSDSNVWVEGRLAELSKLDAIIERLEQEAETSAIGGAGVGGRTRLPIRPITDGAHQDMLGRARTSRAGDAQ
ncbi:site-specific integrase [Microbacterium sp. RU33B]|uniref:tyrosine-type recombinase/integrase n=1 Tax=Microbacterium sp. RU33B TaxID=1907390 RepID=UPI00095AB83B|nr:site-specific integrase [Microbacterium sp. RU33B]SIT72110.1 Phage integrase family protein [Microbacterium sp. RU33B]